MRKLLVILGIACMFMPAFSFAQISIGDTGLDKTGNDIYGVPSGATQDIGSFIGARIIKPLLALVGVIFLVLTIYAGFIWMTAGGEAKNVTKAKDILINAVIGLVLVIIAYAATSFILGALTAWM